MPGERLWGESRLMARIIFSDDQAAERVRYEVASTPPIVGGVGPVRIGIAARLKDGRLVVAHDFRLVDLTWIRAYVGKSDVVVEIE